MNPSLTNEQLLLWGSEDQPPVVILESYKKEPVGALYLNKIDPADVVICKSEKTMDQYYLYIGGVAIYFTYFRKVYPVRKE